MCRQMATQDQVWIDDCHIYIDRPNFQRMLENIKQDNFPDYLYIKDDKRLFRDELEAGDKVEWIWSQLDDKSNTDSPNLLTVSCRTLAV